MLLKALNNYLDVDDIIKVNKSFDNPDIEENVFEESNETLKEKMGEIVTIILETLQYQKSSINLSMEEIQNNVLNIKEMEKIYIVEGEIDALSLHEAGLYSVCSVPNGASKGSQRLEYLDNCWEYFVDKTEIILCTDNDQAGL